MQMHYSIHILYYLFSEQNSFDGGMRDGTEKSFEVDHLATYTSKSGEDLSVSRMGHLMRRGTLAVGQIRRVFGDKG